MKYRTLCAAPGCTAPGVTLAKPVLDPEGKNLLSSGTVLDAEMLERLVRRNVEFIHVLLPDTRDEATVANEIAVLERRLSHIFRGHSSPARIALRAAVHAFRLGTLR